MTRSIQTWAVIPTRGRPTELSQLVSQLRAEDVSIIIVDNGGYADGELPSGTDVHVISDHEQPPNLYRLWNVGIAYAERLCSNTELWNVAIFNDDVELTYGWVNAVATALRSPTQVTAACTGDVRDVTEYYVRDHNIWHRMTPWAFMLRGEAHVRADESFRWWWGDTDLDWYVREHGGLRVIPGYPAKNTLANSTTHGELARQAGRDRQTFARKWVIVPW